MVAGKTNGEFHGGDHEPTGGYASLNNACTLQPSHLPTRPPANNQTRLCAWLCPSQPKDGGRTQDVLNQAAGKLDAYLSENVLVSEQLATAKQAMDVLQQQVTVLRAALAPEPLPHSIQLSVMTDASACECCLGRLPG